MLRPAADVNLTADAVEIRLHGLAALGALRRRVTVPYRHIRSVDVGSVPRGRPVLWRLGGLQAGELLFGTFRRAGRWIFLAIRRRDRVVRIELDGAGPERVRFAEVVVSVDDPDGTAAAIRERVG